MSAPSLERRLEALEEALEANANKSAGGRRWGA
jgi:hypothetical protein